MKLRTSAVAAPALAVAIVATATAGITVAATSSDGVKACETSKGVLAVASTNGRCPMHDQKVTLGAQGPKGATGPSNGYAAVNRSAVPLSATGRLPNHGTAIVSERLPAGSYLLSGAVTITITNTGANNAEEVYCYFLNAGETTPSYYTYLPVRPVINNQPTATVASNGFNGAVTLPDVGTVTLACSGTSAVHVDGSMTAVRTGALTTSGDPDFAMPGK